MTQRAESVLDYRRLKTSRGRFPVADITLQNGPSGFAEIAFAFPGEGEGEGAADGSANGFAPFDLETLSCALPAVATIAQDELLDRLRAAAIAAGPLLGEPTPESVSDWMCEIRIAQAAMELQRTVNGDGALDSPLLPVVKSLVSTEDGTTLFTSYCVSLTSGVEGDARLETLFPRMPWMKRFADESSCDYVFVCSDATEMQHVIDVHLISFPQDIPTVDYSFMTAYFDGLGFNIAEADAAGEFSAGESILATSTLAQQIASVDVPLDTDDLPHLQHVVHALIALHTEGVHVDLFKSDGSRDFLAFDSYASSLWYDFAMRLGAVKVGYCVQCGKGFSLTGHRGMAREYCSETCRTQAKNERRRTQVSRARAMFMDGTSVEAIAREVYTDLAFAPACDTVRKVLRQWPELKHAVEDDLMRGDGSFVRRCVAEGAVDQGFVTRKAKAAAKRRRA